MKKILAVLLVAIMVINTEILVVSAYELSSGTPVLATLDKEIDVDDVKSWQEVHFRVLENVKVGNEVVIPCGDYITGRVTHLKNNCIFGIPGELQIGELSYKTAQGKTISLRGEVFNKGDRKAWANIGWVIVWPLIFVKGNDAKIPAGVFKTFYTAGDYTFDSPQEQPKIAQVPPKVVQKTPEVSQQELPKIAQEQPKVAQKLPEIPQQKIIKPQELPKVVQKVPEAVALPLTQPTQNTEPKGVYSYGFTLAQKDSILYITNVAKNSAADKVGLREGNVILKINNRDINMLTSEETHDLVRSLKGSDNVTLSVKENKKKRSAIKEISLKSALISN